MSLGLTLLAKFGPTLAKLGYGLLHFGGKEGWELLMKVTEVEGREALAHYRKSNLAKIIHKRVIAELEPYVKNTEDKVAFAEAEAIAATVLLGSDFSELLFAHLTETQNVKTAIRSRRGKAFLKGLPDTTDAMAAYPSTLASPLPSSETKVGMMFDRVVDASVKAFAERLHEFPDFQKRFAREVAQRFEAYDARFKALESRVDKETFALIRFERLYRDVLLKSLDKVELFIEHANVHKRYRRQSLNLAYITVQLESSDYNGSAPLPVSAARLLDDTDRSSNRLLILGSAGSGKSTLLRKFALTAAEKKAQRDSQGRVIDYIWSERIAGDEAVDWRNRVPIFIESRDIPKIRGFQPNDFLCSVIHGHSVPNRWVDDALQRGRALLLIDGLDELPPQEREEALEWIALLAQSHHRDNMIVVSSRPQAVESGALAQAGFQEYTILPLGVESRRECVRAWHRAAHYQIAHPDMASREAMRDDEPLSDEMRRHQDGLLAKLDSDPALAQLASNPLLCALLCALNRSTEGELPNTLGPLCDLVVQMLIYDRDRMQAGLERPIPPAYAGRSLRERKAVVGEMAVRCLRDGQDWLTRPDARVCVSEILHGLPDDPSHFVEEVLDGLILRSNLLRNARVDDVEFAHRTVRDYLAALEMAPGITVDELVEQVRGEGRAVWEPVLLFVGLQDRGHEFAFRLMDRLTTPSAGENGVDIRDLRLAFALKNGVDFTPPRSLSDRLDDLALQAIGMEGAEGLGMPTLRSVAQVQAAALRGVAALSVLHCVAGRSEEVDVACIRALVGIDDDAARAAIQDYFTDDAPEAVLEALAEAVGYKRFSERRNVLDLPSVREALQSYSAEPRPFDALVADLSPLAGLTSLRGLILDGTKVSDLSPLAGLKSLLTLSLEGTKITDLTPLAGLKSLRTMYLCDTAVTDLSPLAGLKSLETLYLDETEVAPEQVAKLEKALPNLEVYGP